MKTISPPTAAPLLAFHNSKATKAKYLKRVESHRKADEIISGTYWENGKGCAVGCTLNSASHSAYETELGSPRILAHLEDRLFERLFNAYAARTQRLNRPSRYVNRHEFRAECKKAGIAVPENVVEQWIWEERIGLRKLADKMIRAEVRRRKEGTS